jgi:hypothetical protein
MEVNAQRAQKRREGILTTDSIRSYLKNTLCFKIICAISLERKYNFPVPIKEKERSAFLSTAMQIWKELWRFWIL